MDPIHAIVLAIVQGLSEFLPISSSGHLILVPSLLGWPDQGLAFDVAVHLGTLIAVVLYFRTQLMQMARAWLGSLAGRGLTPDGRLAWCVIIGTIPVGLVGLIFGDYIELMLRNPLFVASTLAGFGILMWLADRLGAERRDEYTVGWRDALLIGAAQALALLPGTSRSGVTMTMARALGLTGVGSARFSFLLAVPGIAMAGGYEFLKLLTGSGNGADWPMMGLGLVVSAVAGYLCIHGLIKFLGRHGLLPFALYRLSLAVVILLVLG
ncbi:MAG: undecaprenyl-diphosphate phosphatase [Steroidobacteraceae bacterium]